MQKSTLVVEEDVEDILVVEEDETGVFVYLKSISEIKKKIVVEEDDMGNFCRGGR